jgi:hypothetical protein
VRFVSSAHLLGFAFPALITEVVGIILVLAPSPQGIGWEYVGKQPTSPTNSLAFSDSLAISDFDVAPSTKSSSYSPTPSSSPTFSHWCTAPRGWGTPAVGCRSNTPSESSIGGTRSKTPSESSSGGGRSSLLEEFRNHMRSFEDLSQIKGHVLEFAKDQVKTKLHI